MLSPDTLAKVAVWRQKIKDGTMTVEEMQQAVAAIRGDRKTAASTSEQSKRAKAKAVVPDAKSMLADLGALK